MEMHRAEVRHPGSGDAQGRGELSDKGDEPWWHPSNLVMHCWSAGSYPLPFLPMIIYNHPPCSHPHFLTYRIWTWLVKNSAA